MPRRKSCLSAYPWRKRKIRRQLETPEQRAIRLEKNRKRIANRRALETEQEREERLARYRTAARLRRANAKSKEGTAKRKIAMLEENSRKRLCKERADKQTNAVCKPIQTRGVRRKKTFEENVASRKCKENISVLSAGGCTALNYSPQMLYNQRNPSYEALLGHTLLQSQQQLQFISMYPKTPEQMLQLGLVACPADICGSSDERTLTDNDENESDCRGLVACPADICGRSDERTLTDNDENESDCSMEIECKVKIEEEEEFEMKVFYEEKTLDDDEMHETVNCAPTLVGQKPSDGKESLAG